MSRARAWLRWVFKVPGEGRLRFPFRALVHGALLLLCALPTMIMGQRLGLYEHIGPLLALNFAVIVPATLFSAVLIDRRSLRELGVPTTPRTALGLLTGTLLGIALIGGVALLEVTFGLATYAPSSLDVPALLASIGIFAMVGIHEELLFRGYYLTNLAEALGGSSERQRLRGIVLAMLLTSIAFGASHLGNDHMTAVGALNIAIAGLFLGLPFVLRGDLGISIGLHFGWNLMQSWLSMAVSGNAIPGHLVTRTLHGPEWITGGAVGPEGGALGLGAILLGTVAGGALAYATRDPGRARAFGMPPQAR